MKTTEGREMTNGEIDELLREQEAAAMLRQCVPLPKKGDNGFGGAGWFVLIYCLLWLVGILGSLYVAVHFVKWAWEG